MESSVPYSCSQLLCCEGGAGRWWCWVGQGGAWCEPEAPTDGASPAGTRPSKQPHGAEGRCKSGGAGAGAGWPGGAPPAAQLGEGGEVPGVAGGEAEGGQPREGRHRSVHRGRVVRPQGGGQVPQRGEAPRRRQQLLGDLPGNRNTTWTPSRGVPSSVCIWSNYQ